MIVVNADWISSWLGVPVSEYAVAESFLLDQGFELEQPAPLFLDDIVVGEIISIKKHDNADKLNICQVSVGSSHQVLQIVCGCSSVAVAAKVAVALVGTDLGEFKIQQRSIRGVDSFGMLCSLSELGFKVKSQGIWHLHPSAPVGEPLNQWLQRGAVRFGIEVTPNRGDCLSVRGISREFALGQSCDSTPPWKDQETPFMNLPCRAVEVSPTASAYLDAFHLVACRRSSGRDKITPDWVKVRLLEAGFSLHHPVVDILNYVMLETGQPFHAYSGQLSGDFQLDMGQNESLLLLNDQEAVLTKDTLVVKHANVPVCIAGYMGGMSSASHADNDDVIIEAACFDREKVAYHCRQFKEFTQSGSRFERGIDVAYTTRALQRALDLLSEILGFEAQHRFASHEKEVPARVIHLSKALPEKMLGYAYEASDMVSAWEKVRCVVECDDDGFMITPPSWRNDLHIPQDMVAEACRMLGVPKDFDVSITLPLVRAKTNHAAVDRLDDSVRSCLVGHGFYETFTYTFDHPDDILQFSTGEDEVVLLKNPISSAYSALRTSLHPGLLKQVKRNLASQTTDVRLFELGRCFRQGESVQEQHHLTVVMTGRVFPESWRSNQTFDFYHAKDFLVKLLQQHGIQIEDLSWSAASLSGLHPHQCSRLYHENNEIAHCGLLHPEIAKSHKVTQPIYFASCNLDWLVAHQRLQSRYMPVNHFPEMRRDLSLIVPVTVQYGDIEQEIRRVIFQFLKKIVIFDRYSGNQIPSDCYSLSVGLLFQHPQRTLQDDDLNPMINELLVQLSKKFDIKQRGR